MTSPTRRTPGRPKHNEQEPSIRDAVLRTASRLFMEHGYDNVSLEHIAECCGVTKASVYYYFSNKATLFATAIVQIMGNIRFYTATLLGNEGSLRERLTQVAAAHLSTRHFDFESMMREAASSLTKQQIQEIRIAELAIHEELIEAFRDAMERKEINEVNPLLAAHTFSAAMLIRNRTSTGLTDDPVHAAEEIVHLFWNGLLPRD